MPSWKRVLLLPTAFLLASCAHDQRKDVSFALLYKSDGFENDAVISAAVAAKFPPGASAAELKRFAIINGSDCSSQTADTLVCEIVTRAQFCAARWIRIEAHLNGDIISSVSSISTGAGC